MVYTLIIVLILYNKNKQKSISLEKVKIAYYMIKLKYNYARIVTKDTKVTINNLPNFVDHIACTNKLSRKFILYLFEFLSI